MPDTHARTGELTLERQPPLAVPPDWPLSSSEVLTPATSCANCNATLAGPYCSNCGQHIADFHRSVWRFVVDFLDSAICWDNKLFRTLDPLIKRPGFLTREFMQGRRVRYVHPLRLFLFTSAVCLTLLQYTHQGLVSNNSQPDKRHQGSRGVKVDFGNPMPASPTTNPVPAAAAPTAAPVPANKTDDETNEQDLGAVIRQKVADEIKPGKPSTAGSDEMDAAIERTIKNKVAKAGGIEKLGRAITDGVQQRLSWVALALLPVFACGLRALYWRKDSYYFEHLIFSLHYHTFLLLFWAAYSAVLVIAEHLPLHALFGAAMRLALLLPPIYLFLGLRRMYGDGPKRTMIKVAILGSMHLLAIVIGVAAVGAAAFFSATT